MLKRAESAAKLADALHVPPRKKGAEENDQTQTNLCHDDASAAATSRASWILQDATRTLKKRARRGPAAGGEGFAQLFYLQFDLNDDGHDRSAESERVQEDDSEDDSDEERVDTTFLMKPPDGDNQKLGEGGLRQCGCDGSSTVLTIALLSRVYKGRPRLTLNLLARPPFRYLWDIVHRVHRD